MIKFSKYLWIIFHIIKNNLKDIILWFVKKSLHILIYILNKFVNRKKKQNINNFVNKIGSYNIIDVF